MSGPAYHEHYCERDAATRRLLHRSGAPLGVFVLLVVLAGVAVLHLPPATAASGPVAAAATSASSPVPTTAPTTAPSPTGCSAKLRDGVWYCRVTMSNVATTAYGLNKPVLMENVSVMSRTDTTVTFAVLEARPCPVLCGATLNVVYLTVPWLGRYRPQPGTVVHLYGRTITGTIKPVAYPPGTGCFIVYC